MNETQTSVTRAGITVECVEGDIVRQPDVDAVVNAANAQLQTGGGVAGAIHRAAGPELSEACRPLAPIRPGEAVITEAGRLPNRHVIHALGPVYGRDTPSDELLGECYRNSLRRAEETDLESLAFPAISTGAFGYPMREAARVAMRTISDELGNLSKVKVIRFVLTDSDALRIHAEAMHEAIGEQ
ncbi:MAG: macro domain-containing protein [Spirochaetota bacterium]